MMKARTVRRISQVFFLFLFLWFCITTTLGDAWWQLRGWPVNWLLELDPLVGLATLLTTGTLYAGLIWGLVSVLLTIALGRFFCGWVCPFGTLHQGIGFLAKRGKTALQKAAMNRYHRLQVIKYWILVFLLAAAAAELILGLLQFSRQGPWPFWGLLLVCLIAGAAVLFVGKGKPLGGFLWGCFAVTAAWLALSLILKDPQLPSASLQIGLLDPLPLTYRSVNLILIPLLDESPLNLQTASRFYEGAGLIAAIFAAALLSNLVIPRFYCRFVCPLGALFGILSRFSLWRIGKTEEKCTDCHLCERNCEGACEPAGTIRIPECVLCLNCLEECRHNLMQYRIQPSATGEITAPDLSRRQLVISGLTGFAALSTLRLNNHLGANWNPNLVRPPGALPEAAFLERCIKCGQCMRICPTNVIQPAGLEGSLEGLWTPVLDFRIGTSGCQYKCIACGHVCPTAAIRPISLDERLGRNQFASAGPIRIGTAFVDRGRCLPWAMRTPCIVCQENCPVSPKAIFTREVYESIQESGPLRVAQAGPDTIRFDTRQLPVDGLATGDYFCRILGRSGDPLRRIVANSADSVNLVSDPVWQDVPSPGSQVDIVIRLQQPYVRPELCIGCGVCQHECPVRGHRAIRVTAENESRNREHRMVLKM
jgi:polyferredoxin/ferredoxin